MLVKFHLVKRFKVLEKIHFSKISTFFWPEEYIFQEKFRKIEIYFTRISEPFVKVFSTYFFSRNSNNPEKFPKNSIIDFRTLSTKLKNRLDRGLFKIGWRFTRESTGIYRKGKTATISKMTSFPREHSDSCLHPLSVWTKNEVNLANFPRKFWEDLTISSIENWLFQIDFSK